MLAKGNNSCVFNELTIREFDAFVVKTSCTRPFARPLELAPDSRLVIMENQGLLEYRSGNFYSKEKLKSFSFRAGKWGHSEKSNGG